jgi:hypothetical protein
MPLNADEKDEGRTLFRSEGSRDYMIPYGWTPDGKQLLVVRVMPDGVTSQIAMVSVFRWKRFAQLSRSHGKARD